MKNLLSLFLLFAFIPTYSQQAYQVDSIFKLRPEVYFSLDIDDIKALPELDRMMYIDDIQSDVIYAYANRSQFLALIAQGWQPRLLAPPSMTGDLPLMKDYEQIRETNEWNFYPTYDAYLSMMQAFEDDYPDLCTIYTIGILSSGRKILAARINTDMDAGGKPEFLYTAPIHGDELVGYILNLRLIDYLLSNYGIDPRVTNLVDNVDIWINPLANPNGTYAGGNQTVWGATRGNSNGIDLNRNYPDPEDGTNPDGNPHQPETVAFMDFAGSRNFVMSANHHSGAEVINYPWDTWSRLHADNDWWVQVSREYADTAQFFSAPGYLTDLDNGITNGYAWYTISGGRQDYMNYFHHCREVTSELSNVKMLPATSLPAFWEYNYRSLLNYMEQSLFGIRGVVTDSVTGEAVRAKIEVMGHDFDFSHIYSALPAGNYHRLIKSGVYNLFVTADGYEAKIIPSVQVFDRQTTIRDVQLVPVSIAANFEASTTRPAKGQWVNFTDLSYGEDITSWEWTFEGGIPATSDLQNPAGVIFPAAGNYDVSLKVTNQEGEESFIVREDYLTVISAYLMQNAVFQTCSGSFFDSGNDLGDYQNNEDFTAIFYPGEAEKVIKITFNIFNLEANANCDYDWLKVYNGSSTDAPLLGTWCGTNSPGIITATNDEGALTVRFHSDESERRQGWYATIGCTTAVGITEHASEKIRLSPNPFRGNELYVQSNDVIIRTELIDLNGKVIAEENGCHEHAMVVRTGQLLPGVYCVRVTSEQGIYVKKIIRLN